MATLMTSGLVTPSSSQGRIIYEGGEVGKVLPFVTSLGLWITIGARKWISKWEFRINESQENQQETQFIRPLTDRNSALKKCSLHDVMNDVICREFTIFSRAFRIALRHVKILNQWDLRFSPWDLRFSQRGLRFSPRGLRFSPRGLRFSPWGLRFSPRGLRQWEMSPC